MDLRNFLAFAAVLEHIYSPASNINLIPQLFINLDMTSMPLKKEPHTIFLSTYIAEQVHAHHRAPGVTMDETPDRWLHLLPAISAAGELLCVIVVIRDHKFTTMDIIKLQSQHPELWLWYGPPREEGKGHLMRTALKSVIIPAARRIRQREQEDAAARQQMLQQLVSAEAAAKAAAAAAKKAAPSAVAAPAPAAAAPALASGDATTSPIAPLRRIVISLDGERTGLEAAMETAAAVLEEEGMRDVELLKFSAACSKTQQPCDVSPVFRVLKQIYKARSFEKSAEEPAFMELVRQVLKPMDTKARALYSEALAALPELLLSAFSSRNIRQGWEIAGIYPFSAQTILKQSPADEDLTAAQEEALLRAVSKAAQHIHESGQVTDAQLQEAVGAAVEFPLRNPPVEEGLKRKPRRVKELHEYVVGRRRALLLSHPSIARAKSTLQAIAERDSQGEAPAEVSE